MRAIAFATLLSLAGCTSVDYDLGSIVPQPQVQTASVASAYPVARTNPRFGDSDPVSWTDRQPWAYPVHGTDVSKYQNHIDWEAARDSGISFAFIKATEGGDRVDEFFKENWRATKAAGIPRGAYHFYYFCRPAAEQADWFIRNVPRDAAALPPVLDMEWNPLSPTCRRRPAAEIVQREMRIFLKAIERHYGKRPIIYTSMDFYEDNRLHEFRGYEWWLRSVAAHPDDEYDGRQFLFWQYTGTGIVPGIEGDADINVFNGSALEWRDWLDGGGAPPTN